MGEVKPSLMTFKDKWTFPVNTVILTALGVGGATVLGGAIGLIFHRTSKKFCDVVLSFAAGVMLAASMLGLILPSLEYGGRYAVWITVFGIFFGALCVNLLDLLIPHVGLSKNIDGADREKIYGVFLFVMAIALHNLPEGVAAGVGLGTDNPTDAILIATAIALQNIPEGLIVTVAMLGVGVGRLRAFLISSVTGVIEIVGTFIGFFAVSISSAILPLILAFAGGTMLYVISEEMIPQTHSDSDGKLSTYFLLIGFCFMLILNALL